MPQRDMAWDTFTGIVDAIAQPGATASLQGKGEPTRHPRFWDRVAYVHHKHHQPYSIINGSRVDVPGIGVPVQASTNAYMKASTYVRTPAATPRTCRFIKDTDGIESIAGLRTSIQQGHVPKGCTGCDELRPGAAPR